MDLTLTASVSPAPTAWVGYDATCGFCVGMVERWRRTFERAGLGFVPLQDPDFRRRARLVGDGPDAELKLLLPGGEVLGGVRAIAWMCRRVAWLWPVGVLMVTPVIHWVTDATYRWIARNRSCLSGACALPMRPRRRRTRTILEFP